ncbi:ATP-binding protein [Lusitaniella coriacea LEGE 07157]|uniref:ATP-binding protein n=1 Tax=Lusitaniella coriacea LEGE 07157 TaxID=945747 RepID=A0A8J7DW69_9CYAN|nr:ATP-binding protein [Lusitaniella coriacea]MBE9116289.1 ATP-binding protein [Lusitaniella coriacea LEGE 07157]
MSQNRLELFREAYRNLELLPLVHQKELQQFKVNYGGETIEELEQLVKDSPSRNGKIIFTGHRGCGKSTLLADFSEQLSNEYFVVFFSVADEIEMSDINHINILFAIALKLISEAESRQIAIPPNTQKALSQWFASRTRTETEGLAAEVGGGFSLLKLISGKLKVDATVRNEIKQEFERKITDLVAKINEIAAIINAVTTQEVLVIIDDLDKLELARVNDIYRDNIKALCLPNFQIIYTIPIAVLRDKFLRPLLETETNDQIVVMPVLKLFDKEKSHQPDAEPRAEAKELLVNILEKRILPELIQPKTLDKVVLKSGGVLREMIRIANECCRICLRQIRREPDREVIIDDDVLDEAVSEIRNDFDILLGKADYEILVTVYREFKPEDPKQPEFLDLLHGLSVLEYRNRQNWYDVHPIVVELLWEQNLLNP